jgi:hypothetical protein
MIALDPLEVLLETYPAAREQEIQELLRKNFDKRVQEVRSWHQRYSLEGDPEVTDTQIEAVAATEMAKDLSYYREQARNILDGYQDGRFTRDEAIERTNVVLAGLTGLRFLLDCMRAAPLGDVLHARLDTRVEVLMEEIVTKLTRKIEQTEVVTVSFLSSPGVGLTL